MGCVNWFCGDNPEEACGYPPKTIRAIISVSACLISFTVLAFLAIFLAIKGEYTQSMGSVGILSTELGTIVGYYFGTRSKQDTVHELELQRQIFLQSRISANNRPNDGAAESEDLDQGV